MKLKLILSYEGTSYCGWQVQKNGVSVQEELHDAVYCVYGQRGKITGCSRTDSGVHANFYCCTVAFESEYTNIPIQKIPVALNHFLPEDISVISADYVSDEFHPRYDVLCKEYEYLIWNSCIRNPFYRNRAFVYPKTLDEKLMNQAAQLFVGKHDFASFMSSGSSVENTVRTIHYFNVLRKDEMVIIRVCADGFLYNMVRILVGTLIEISEKRINLCEIDDIIKSKDRKKAGFTAASMGLYLNKVIYRGDSNAT